MKWWLCNVNVTYSKTAAVVILTSRQNKNLSIYEKNGFYDSNSVNLISRAGNVRYFCAMILRLIAFVYHNHSNIGDPSDHMETVCTKGVLQLKTNSAGFTNLQLDLHGELPWINQS